MTRLYHGGVGFTAVRYGFTREAAIVFMLQRAKCGKFKLCKNLLIFGFIYISISLDTFDLCIQLQAHLHWCVFVEFHRDKIEPYRQGMCC